MSTTVHMPSAHELWALGKVPYSQQPPEFSLTDLTRLRRFTVDEYRTMVKAGVFGDYEPGELLEGVILWKFRPMTPRECFPQHALMTLELNTPRLARSHQPGHHSRRQ